MLAERINTAAKIAGQDSPVQHVWQKTLPMYAQAVPLMLGVHTAFGFDHSQNSFLRNGWPGKNTLVFHPSSPSTISSEH